MGTNGRTVLGPVDQVGIVVPDIAAAVDRYRSVFGVEEWLRYTYGPGFVPELWYRGEPAAFSMHVALGGTDPQIELIEPVAGPSLYHDFLDRNQPGVQHLGVFVDSLDDAVAFMRERGYGVLQMGRGYGLDGDGGFAYFDTTDDHHTTVEAIERPRRRRPPLADWDRVTPAG